MPETLLLFTGTATDTSTTVPPVVLDTSSVSQSRIASADATIVVSSQTSVSTSHAGTYSSVSATAIAVASATGSETGVQSGSFQDLPASAVIAAAIASAVILAIVFLACIICRRRGLPRNRTRRRGDEANRSVRTHSMRMRADLISAMAGIGSGDRSSIEDELVSTASGSGGGLEYFEPGARRGSFVLARGRTVVETQGQEGASGVVVVTDDTRSERAELLD
ncbi:hypothetical protein HDU82_004787 [Entophlyctis luteolus]|nr:hypothetical protein HDU82_004787 [Entophlyctis luteolus]